MCTKWIVSVVSEFCFFVYQQGNTFFISLIIWIINFIIILAVTLLFCDPLGSYQYIHYIPPAQLTCMVWYKCYVQSYKAGADLHMFDSIHNVVRAAMSRKMYDFNTLGPRQNGRYLVCSWMKISITISIIISLKFVPKGSVNNIPTLITILAWRRPGNKPLSEPMVVILLTHICFALTRRLTGGKNVYFYSLGGKSQQQYSNYDHVICMKRIFSFEMSEIANTVLNYRRSVTYIWVFDKMWVKI